MSKDKDQLRNNIVKKKNAVQTLMDEYETTENEVVEEEQEIEEETIEETAKENSRNQPKKKTRKKETITPQIEENKGPVETDDNFWEKMRKGNSEPLNRKKELTTFYMDADLHDIVQKLYEKNGKGFKSKLINESIRLALKEKGLV